VSTSFFTDRYTSAEQLQREVGSIFRRTWIVAARDSDVAHAGDCLAFDELDQALILARGNDGVVRAFRNACRHRGTRILCGRHRGQTLTCPYHGWQYGLDGRLTRVPAVEGFAGLDFEAHGLTRVRAESFAGFVWVSFDEGTPPLREYLASVADQLEPYQLERMRPIRRKVWTLPCNWKILVDNNIERYHVASVHRLWSAVLAPETPVFHDLGIHHLFSVSMGNYRWRTALDRLTMPPDLPLRPEEQGLYQRYLVFPNTLISALPYHLTVFRVFPLAPDRCRFHYEFHVRDDASVLARLRGQLTQLASLRIVREDNATLELVQRGVATGRQAIPLHREEGAIAHFHAVVDRFVAQA
jgi:phenylpropionate dioxygenase-like ring-hydroxylating dioxygenase large terminal subunit